MRSFFWGCCLLLIISNSCTYQPEESFEINPITPPSGNDTSIKLSVDDNPINLFDRTLFSFSITPSDKQIYVAQINYDGSPINSTAHTNGTFFFILDPTGHPENGTLKIRVIYPSNSPSLAGQLGAEFIVFEKTWDVKVDVTLPPPIPAPNIEIEDGRLMIRWQTPPKFNFSKLRVVRQYQNGRVDTVYVKSIRDTNVEDRTYTGGKVSYSVDMRGFNYKPGIKANFDSTPITLAVDNKTGEIKWSRPLLYNNSNLTLYVGMNYYPIGNEGAYNPNTRFGEWSLVKAMIAANGMTDDRKPTVPFETQIKSFIGSEIPKFNSADFIPTSNVYLLQGATTLYSISESTLSIVNSTQLPSFVYQDIRISQDNMYAYLFDNNTLYRVDLNTLTIAETIPISYFFGSFLKPTIQNLTVANGNLLCVTFSGAPKRSYIFDMTTRNILYETTASSFPAISPDGKYLIQETQIYERGSNTWDTPVAKIPIGTEVRSDMIKQNGDDTFLMGSINGKLNIFNINGPLNNQGELVSIFEFPISGSYTFDPTSNAITISTGTEYSNTIDIYSFETREKIKTYSNISGPPRSALYMNNKLLHSAGFILNH